MEPAIESAQTLLELWDTGMTYRWRNEDKSWREEDRRWRAEDMEFRKEERKWMLLEHEMRESERIWRKEDMEQRNVENARYLWMRFVEKNRRNVEEKSEQLKSISNLAALFAGFAVVTLTQFNFEKDQSSRWLIACYGVLTAISVSLHTISMVLCTLILGSILKKGKTFVDESAEERFMIECEKFSSFSNGLRPPAPSPTFEEFWEMRCDGDWNLAFFLFTWGVFSFLVGLIPIGWIKFYYSKFTSCMFMGVVIISIGIWIWKLNKWGSYLIQSREVEHEGEDDAETVISTLPFAWHIAPRLVSRTLLTNEDSAFEDANESFEDANVDFNGLNDDRQEGSRNQCTPDDQ